MKKVVLILLLLITFQSILSQTPQMSENDRIRLAEAFRLSDRFSEKVWKDWSKPAFAVLLITPENEFLIRHPAPSNDFAESGYDKLLKSKVYWRKRVFSPNLLATFPAIQGSAISTIVVGQAENTFVKTSTPWVVTVLHEHFHQLQDSQPNMYQATLDLGISGGDQTGMWMLNYPFPYSEKSTTQKFNELARQLAKTLETKDSTVFQNELRNYLAMREVFNKSLKPNDYKYLSFQLWKEGVARYTEYEIAKFATEKYRPSKEFRSLRDFEPYSKVADAMRSNIIAKLKTINLSETQREVAYPFGAGEALLLDKAKIDWKSRYFNEKFYLDNYFDAAK
jgi:hypothetical protein